MAEQTERQYSLDEVAELLQTDPATIPQATVSHEVVRIQQEDLDAFLEQNGPPAQEPGAELECTLNIEDYAEDFAALEAQLEADTPELERLLHDLDDRAEELLRSGTADGIQTDDADDRFTWKAGDVVITDRDGNPIDMEAFAAEALDDEDDDGEANLTRNWMHF